MTDAVNPTQQTRAVFSARTLSHRKARTAHSPVTARPPTRRGEWYTGANGWAGGRKDGAAGNGHAARNVQLTACNMQPRRGIGAGVLALHIRGVGARVGRVRHPRRGRQPVDGPAGKESTYQFGFALVLLAVAHVGSGCGREAREARPARPGGTDNVRSGALGAAE